VPLVEKVSPKGTWRRMRHSEMAVNTPAVDETTAQNLRLGVVGAEADVWAGELGPFASGAITVGT